MAKTLEAFWLELRSRWLDHAFPVSRDTFREIVTDITENQYTSAEAIVKHIAEGSGISPPEFTQLMRDKFRGQLYQDDAQEFVDGYGKLTMLLQVGFLLAVEGSYATQELMRQWSLTMDRERFDFLVANIEPAAELVRQDRSGRTMMTRFADIMTRNSTGNHFSEGVKTAHDTFMAYSKCLEAYMSGGIQ